ncbi:hypothetical protein ACFL44_03735, partial [Gemmatimonadota bacterium]
DVEVVDGYVLLPLRSTGELQFLDVSNPSSPFLFLNTTILGDSDQNVRNIEHLQGGTTHATDVIATVGWPNDPVAAGYDLIIDFFAWNPANTGFELIWLDDLALTAPTISLYGEALFENQAYFALGSSGTAAVDITGITTGSAPTFAGTPYGKFASRGVAVDPYNNTLLIAEVLFSKDVPPL